MTDQITISLDAEHIALARDEAGRLGITLEAYVSRLVDGNLPVPSAVKPHISAIFGIGASAEATDIARDKRQMIGDAVSEEELAILRPALAEARVGLGLSEADTDDILNTPWS